MFERTRERFANLIYRGEQYAVDRYGDLDRRGYYLTDFGYLDPDLAMKNDVVYRCIDILRGAIMQMPLMVEGARSARLMDLLNKRPNTTMSGPELLSWIVTRRYLWGVAYVEIQRVDGGGREGGVPVSLQCHTKVEERRNNPRDMNEPPVFLVGQDRRQVNVGDMLCFRMPDKRSILVDGAFTALRNQMAIDIHSETRFSSGFWQTILLRLQDRATPELVKKTQEAWKANFGKGVRGESEPMVVGRQVRDAQRIMPTSREVQLLEDKRMTALAQARAFGVPAHMLNLEVRGTTYGVSYREQRHSFTEQTKLPLAISIAQEFERGFYPMSNGTVRFDPRAIDVPIPLTPLEESQVSIAEYMAGLITREEARMRLGMPEDAMGEFMEMDAPAQMRALDRARALAQPVDSAV